MSIASRVAAARTLEQKLGYIASGIDKILRGTLPPHPHESRAKPEKVRPAVRALESLDVVRVFEHWRKVTNHPRARLTDERRRLVQARMKEGYTPERLLMAIDGCASSDYHMARGKWAPGRVYNDLMLICRNGAKVEQFEEMAPAGGLGEILPLTPDVSEAWEKARHALRTMVGESVWSLNVSKLTAVGVAHDGALVLQSDVGGQFIAARYGNLLKLAVNKSGIRKVEIVDSQRRVA